MSRNSWLLAAVLALVAAGLSVAAPARPALARVTDPGAPLPTCSPPDNPTNQPCLHPNFLATADPDTVVWAPETLDNGVVIGGRVTLTWRGSGTPNWHCNQPGCLRVLDPANLGSSTTLVGTNHIASGAPAVAALGDCGTSTSCSIVLLTSPQIADWFQSFGPGPQYQVAIIPLNRAPSAATMALVSRDGPFTYTFRAQGGSDPDGDPVTYSWSFLDGGGGNGETATHTFPGPGTYEFSVAVTDPEGAATSTKWSELHAGELFPVGDPFVVTVETDPTVGVGQLFDVRLRLYNQDFAPHNSVLRVTPPAALVTTGSVTQVGGPEPSQSTDLDAQESIEYVYRYRGSAATHATFTTTVNAIDLTGGGSYAHEPFEPAAIDVVANQLLHVDDIVYSGDAGRGPLGYAFDVVISPGDPARGVASYEWRIAKALHDVGYQPGIGSFFLGAADEPGLYRVTLIATDDDPDGAHQASRTEFFFLGDGGLTPTLSIDPTSPVTSATSALKLNVRNDHSAAVDTIDATVAVVQKPAGASVTVGDAVPATFPTLAPREDTNRQWPLTVDTEGHYKVSVTVTGRDADTGGALPPRVAELTFDAKTDALTVNSVGDQKDGADDGACDVDLDEAGSQCTLRAAITEANRRGSSVIDFRIDGSGPHTITVHSELPAITSPVRIDATTEPGYVDRPVIALDGSAMTEGYGLVLQGGNSTVRGLSITGFRRSGIQFGGTNEFGSGDPGNRIEESWIGVTPDGTSAGNGVGVGVNNTLDTTIGGSVTARNVIAGNFLDVVIAARAQSTSSASGTVSHNLIGLAPDGVTPLDVTGPPTVVRPETSTNQTNVLIQGAVSAADVHDNEIAPGGEQLGIWVRNSLLTAPSNVTIHDNTVRGGLLAVWADGSAPLMEHNTLLGADGAGGLLTRGVVVTGAAHLTSNDVDGYDQAVLVGGADGAVISGNRFGLHDGSPPAVLAITLAGATHTTISGNDVANAVVGIFLFDADNNTIRDNRVGSVAHAGAPNEYGIAVVESARNAIGPGNDISGNGQSGVRISATAFDPRVPLPAGDGRATTDNRIFGNQVGHFPAVQPVGIVVHDHGVENTVIGGPNASDGNTIDRGSAGVLIDTAGTGAVVRNNTVTDAAVAGVAVTDTSGVTIDKNTITSAQGGDGVALQRVNDVTVRANAIGPNSKRGILIENPDDNGGVRSPVLSPTGVRPNGVTAVVTGAPGATVEVDAFGNGACDASGTGEGERYLGTASTVIGSGPTEVFVPFASTQLVGTIITTTATIDGATSAFSECGSVIPGAAKLTAPAPAGSTHLETDTNLGFTLGQVVAVNAGQPNEDLGIYVAQGSIVIDRPLAYAHTVGEPVTPTINAPNLAPWCTAQSLTADEDSAVDGTTTCTDETPATLVFRAASGAGPQHGTLVVNGNGTWRYTPAANYAGGDSFAVEALDAAGVTGRQTVSMTLRPVNDVPVCTARSANVDTGATVSIAPSCTDADGDALTYGIVSQGTLGTASVASGQLRYAAGSAPGADQFTYRASDATSPSAPATVSVRVNAPVPVPGFTVTVTSLRIFPGSRFVTAALGAQGRFEFGGGATASCGEDVTLTIGAFSEVLSGRNFRSTRTGCVYTKAARSGGFVDVFTIDFGHRQWTAVGSGNQPTFGSLTASTTVGLRIGDDSATTTVRLTKILGVWFG